MTQNKKLVLLSIYSTETIARYLLSSYVLKAYLTKHLKDKNLTVDVVNFSDDKDVSEIVKDIADREPDFVGYSCYIWNINKILDVVQKLKKEKDSTINIFGGPELSIKRISSFPNPKIIDYYVIGEEERKLTSLLHKLMQNEKEVPAGIAYWSDDKLTYAENKSSITNLDEIPSIYLDGVIDDKLYASQQAFMETQRGCIYKCKYCVYHKNLSCITYYSMDRIFAELNHLIVDKKVRALRIFDAVFTSNIKHAKEIVKYLLALKKSGVRLPWIYWELTPQNVDEEFIQLTAALKSKELIDNTNKAKPKNRPQVYSDMLKGYTVVNCLGIQSFNIPSLRAVSRASVSRERLAKFLALVKKHNIVLKMDVILGLPLESFNTYFEGLEFFLPFFRDTDHILNIHVLQILPGSDLEPCCDEYEVLYYTDAPHFVYSTPTFSEKELQNAAKLSAVLFRLLNSPLRKQFFMAKERSQMSYLEMVRFVYEMICSESEFRNVDLVAKEFVDDVYWNGDIFKDIPSEWLANLFEGLPEK